MKKLKINVIQEDIDQGTPAAATRCPVAIAIQREYPEFEMAKVGFGYTDLLIKQNWFQRITDRQKRWRLYANDSKVNTFIIDYDSRRDVEPFSAELVELVERKVINV